MAQRTQRRLAEIVVLDRPPGRVYRERAGLPERYSSTGHWPRDVAAKADRAPTRRTRLYVHAIHTASRDIHEIAERLFKERGLESNYDFELRHKAIIDRFDRYPHRNAILGRQSTEEERAFLAQPGSSF